MALSGQAITARSYGSGAGKKSRTPAGGAASDAMNVVKIASEISPGNLYGLIIRVHLFRRASALS